MGEAFGSRGLNKHSPVIGGIASTRLYDKIFETGIINSLSNSSNNTLISNNSKKLLPVRKSLPKFRNIRALLIGRRIREIKEMLSSPNERVEGEFWIYPYLL